MLSHALREASGTFPVPRWSSTSLINEQHNGQVKKKSTRIYVIRFNSVMFVIILGKRIQDKDSFLV